MAKPVLPTPLTRKPKTPVRLPQRSQEVSGDEVRNVPASIAAADGKAKKQPH